MSLVTRNSVFGRKLPGNGGKLQGNGGKLPGNGGKLPGNGGKLPGKTQNNLCSHRSQQEHYENTPMQYIVIFHGCKNDNFQLNFF